MFVRSRLLTFEWSINHCFVIVQNLPATGPLTLIEASLVDRSASGIASAMNRLISGGQLVSGDRLPTVRVLAHRIGVSPSTVSEAWQVLGDAGSIAARGRLGTIVVGRSPVARPTRYRNVTGGQFALDLSTGTPDPALLPDLSRVLAAVAKNSLTSSYLDDPVYPPLGEQLRATWPFPAEAITVVDGCMDALDRLASSLIRLGDRVVVENPTFPPLLDLLEQLGAEIITVELDAQGITIPSMTRALTHDPVLVFTQPRAHNPTAVSTSASRTAALAALLRPGRALVVEDDHANEIATAPLASLGTHLPERTIHIRGFSKSHGPDLRLAAVGGAGEPILRMAQRRILGPGWSSRLLQAVLAEVLIRPTTREQVRVAREEYGRRRLALSAALRSHHIEHQADDGINMWIRVADERDAQLGLAARGIGVAPGSPFAAQPLQGDHIRLTVGQVRTGIEELAAALASVEAASFQPALRSR